eukprot:203207-Chlamydomonas_euryale.AAC.2
MEACGRRVSARGRPQPAVLHQMGLPAGSGRMAESTERSCLAAAGTERGRIVAGGAEAAGGVEAGAPGLAGCPDMHGKGSESPSVDSCLAPPF